MRIAITNECGGKNTELNEHESNKKLGITMGKNRYF